MAQTAAHDAARRAQAQEALRREQAEHSANAGQEKSPERPVLTVRQVFDLADAIDPRYRALILPAAFCSLRWGELAALRPCHIDLAAGVLQVEASVSELIDGSLVTGPPKSAAGRRLVSIPAAILPDVTTHLDGYALPSNDSLVFTGPMNAPLRRSNFTRPGHRSPRRLGSPASTSTTCAIPGTCWPPRPGRACAS